jgi:hypothetical protein
MSSTGKFSNLQELFEGAPPQGRMRLMCSMSAAMCAFASAEYLKHCSARRGCQEVKRRTKNITKTDNFFVTV